MTKKAAKRTSLLIALFSLLLVCILAITTLASTRSHTICQAQLILRDNLDLVFYADINEQTAKDADTYMRFDDGDPVRYSNMQTVDGISYACFRYAGVLPQDISDSVTATLYVQGVATDTNEYSVKTYCEALLGSQDASALEKQVVSDLLVYGAATQSFLGEQPLATQGVSGLTPSDAPLQIKTLYDVTRNDDLPNAAHIFLDAVGLRLTNDVEFYFDISADTELTTELSSYDVRLNINGRELHAPLFSNGTTYRAVLDGVMISEFFDKIKVGIYCDGVRVSDTVTLSMASYVQALNSTETYTQLTDALYNYGLSVHRYVGNHTLEMPGGVKLNGNGTASLDDGGTITVSCKLCEDTLDTLTVTHARTFDALHSNGAPANASNGSLFTLSTPTDASGNTYYSIYRDTAVNTGSGSLGYYFTKAQSRSAASFMDSTGQYTGGGYYFSFDVRAPEGGIAPTSINLQNTRTSGTGRWGNILSIGADGSLSLSSSAIAPAGTVNKDSWTNVCIVIDFCTINGTECIYLEYYVNQEPTASVYIDNAMYNGTFTQMHLGMGTKDLLNGQGLLLDNFLFAQGAPHAFSGSVEEHLEQLDREALLDIIDLIQTGYSIDDFSTVVRYNSATKQTYTQTQSEFISLNTNQYSDPLSTPTANQHPRLLFNESDIPDILAAMQREENATAMRAFTNKVVASTDGKLTPIEYIEEQSTQHLNYDAGVLGAIEAKALYYALYKDVNDGEHDDALMRGYQAIYAMKNYLLTLDIQWKASDQCRLYGHVMYVTALVYDWCYDLLSDADKEQLMLGVQNLCCDGTSNNPAGGSTHNGLKLETGFPPQSERQIPITGHGAEFQLLRDYFSFAIAIFDEDPTWYDNIGGLIYQDYIAVRDYFYTSGFYPDGSAVYNQYRFLCDLWNAWLFEGMGIEIPYNTTDMATVVHGMISMETYDKTQFATGDGSGTSTVNGETANSILSGTLGDCALLSSYLFEDPVALAIAMELRGDYQSFSYSQSGISAADYLILTSKGLTKADDYKANVKNVTYHGGFQQQIIVRDGKEEDSVVVLMQGAQHLPGGHTHQNAGNFQIYYKGMLTRDDGLYDAYGSNHHYYYHMSTTAHNGLLVYNPSLASTMNGYYNGGQRLDLGVPYEYETWIENERFSFGELIGMQYDSEDHPTYVYFANDITKAYDSVTVDYVERSFMTLYTGDDDVPMVMFIFDNITSDDASFQKTFLLQCVSEPTISGNTVTVDNGEGKLVLTSLKGADTIKAYGRTSVNGVVGGGTGSERFYLSGPGINLGTSGGISDSRGDLPVVWGHVEIQPNTGSKTNRLMNVIYVTDSGKTVSATPTLVESAHLTGATFRSYTSMFVSDPSYASSTLSFTTSGNGTMTYYIGGLNEGTWTVSIGGQTLGEYTATSDGHMITFEGAVGTVTLTPGDDIRPANSGFINYNLNGGRLGADATKYYALGQSLKLPTPTKSGAVFDGWFSDASLTQPISEVPADAGASYDVYAKWCDALVDLDYTSMDTLLDDPSVEYVTVGNTGTLALVGGADAHLLWTADGAGSYIQKSGSFASLLRDEHTLSLCVTLSQDGQNTPLATRLSLRAVADGISIEIPVLSTLANGSVILGSEQGTKILGDLTNGTITLRVAVDFASEMIRAYDEQGSCIASLALADALPLPSSYTSYTEWLESFSTEEGDLFVWSALQTGSLRIHSITEAAGNVFAACRHDTVNSELHTWDEGKILIPASTVSCREGQMLYTCTACGVIKYASVPSVYPHTLVYGYTGKTDVCGTQGTLTYSCSVCKEDIVYVHAAHVKTFEHCGCASLVGASSAAADYSDQTLALIGAFNASNPNLTNNLDIRLAGTETATEGDILKNDKVIVIGFDVLLPDAGFSESGANLNVKLGGSWYNTGLSIKDGAISGTTSSATFKHTMQPGVAVNVVVKMDLTTTGTVRYDFFINGEYMGYKSIAHSAGADANWYSTASTYVNLTISRNSANVDKDRGLILDNLFIADELPFGLSIHEN